MIEIIVAIGVLSILFSILLVTINPIEQFKKVQDSKRKSDLAQIQRGLEAYYQDFGRYPSHSTGANAFLIMQGSEAKAWGSSWSPYIGVLPKDPSDSKIYVYYSDPASSLNNQTYLLYASLDRGDTDSDACNEGDRCERSSFVVGCPDAGNVCNYGVSSPNVSP